MKEFLNASEKESGKDVIVDPNDVRLNAAGTHMTVAVYSEEAFNVGDRRPSHQCYHSLSFLPKDLETMDAIFAQEIVKRKNKLKKKQATIRAIKKIAKSLKTR